MIRYRLDMKNKKEHFLAIKISIALLAILVLIFSVLLYLNFEQTLDKEKRKFEHDISMMPMRNILKILHWEEIPRNLNLHKRLKKAMMNIYIHTKSWEELKRGVFEYVDFWEKGFSHIPEKEVFLWGKKEKVLLYKRENKQWVFIVGKNISFVYEWFWRLLYLSLILGIFSLLFIYIFSYKIAKKMLLSMREANKKLKDYNHNVAHELKTPLAVLKSNLELLDLWKKCNTKLLISSSEEIWEMQNIIDAILFLSEYEANNKNLEREDLDLEKYVYKIWSKYNKELKISDYSENNKIKANKDLLKRLLKNIFENAEKYKKKQTKVRVNISKKKWKIILKVENICRDTSLKHLKNTDNLFESFTQADSSRNSLGYGLWLSIVKKICDIHGWEVNNRIKKTTFVLKVVFEK